MFALLSQTATICAFTHTHSHILWIALWDICDSWRHANPTENTFIYRAQTHAGWIQSWLDRIYIAKRVEQYTFDWKIQETAVPTDHAMVSVWYVPKAAPFIGHGRWSLPAYLLNDKSLIAKIAESSTKFLADATRIWVERIDRKEINIQTLWEEYKKTIKCHAKDMAKECHHKITSRIQAIEKDIRMTNNDQSSRTNNKICAHKAYLLSQLKQLKKKKGKQNSELISAKLVNHGKKLEGIWSALGKEKRPRNLIHRLKIPNSNPLQYKRHSKRMAELA